MFTPSNHFRTASRLTLCTIAALLLAALPFPHAAQKADPPGQQPQPAPAPQQQQPPPMGGAGYSSQNDPCVYFGLGASAKVDKLEVVWPGGTREVFDVPGVDRTLTLVEGKGAKP